MDTKKKVKLHNESILLLLAVLGFSSWWVLTFISADFRDKSTTLLSEVYGLVALCGGLYGLSVARGWGFFKSYFGKAIIFLSLGLLLQEFGQLSYSYLNSIKHVAVPYPSIPDIGFYGSIPMYIFAVFELFKGLGIYTLIKKSPIKIILSIVMAVIVLISSYSFLLKGYSATDKPFAAVFFDLAYPLSQVIYVSLALVIMLFVRNMLGGTMRKPVILLLAAFAAQYLSDFNFLYQTHHETWAAGRYGDYFYFISYCLMVYSVIKLNYALKAFMPKKVLAPVSDGVL